MENVTLAVVTLALFMLLFVVAIFADRAGMSREADIEEAGVVPLPVEPMLAPVDDAPTSLSA